MPIEYGLFFSRKTDGLLLRLPINPEELPVVRETENDDENVLGLGPIMIPRIPGLRTVFTGQSRPNDFNKWFFQRTIFLY